MAGSSKVTIDHMTIRKWIEERGGFPAKVRGTGGKEEPGVLRIDYEGYSGKESLERISLEDFFEKFEEADLAFLYQDETRDGEQSRFSKFVSRSDEQ